MSPEPLSEATLSSLLKETFLREIRHFGETDSTNTQSLNLFASGEAFETPLLVYAEQQSAGRGRGTNTWWSQPGSLTFSVIVDAAELGITPDRQPQLSLLTGLALLHTGQSLVPRGDFAVKWPNDVYLAGRKLAGILTEIPPGSPSYAVIGIGFNINNSIENAPGDLPTSSASLIDHLGHSLDRLEILKQFLQQLDEQFLRLSQGQPVFDQWSEHCLLTGKTVTLEAGPRTVTGVCQGVDQAGSLLLKTERGVERMLGGVVVEWSSN